MTVSEPHHPATDDAQASLRAELIGKLAGAQMALERVMADLARNGGSISVVASQISLLAGLQTSVGTASTATLAVIRGEIAAAVAESKAVADQARGEIASNTAGSALALANAAGASRTAVNDAMDYLRHTPLTFTTPEDEAEYRKREDERKAYITAQQAKHTPEGDLNASGAAVGQMVDAKAHGANGLEFDQRWNELVTTTERLREAAKANGVSTEEFNRRLREDLRHTLKSKGLSDAQIDAQFAANPDPLVAAKTFVHDEGDLAKFKQSAERADAMGKITDSAAQSDVASLVASLQNAGVVAMPHNPAANPDHGVAVAALATSARTV